MLSSAGVGFIANIVREAQKYKYLFGLSCYTIATLQEALLGRMRKYKYNLELDGKKAPEISSVVIFINNAKYCGGGMLRNPFSCMNDGLMDLLYSITDNNLIKVSGDLDKAKTGGT